MSTLKSHIIASYGASVQKKTITLKEAKKNTANSKNQFIFLQRCVKHKVIPKSLRMRCPLRNERSKEIMKRYHGKKGTQTKKQV